ncbi:unnamed protein product, partial [Polarella glacialis]
AMDAMEAALEGQQKKDEAKESDELATEDTTRLAGSLGTQVEVPKDAVKPERRTLMSFFPRPRLEGSLGSQKEAPGEVDQLKADVAEMRKQLQISGETRMKESQEFQTVVEEQKKTQVVLKKALKVLKDFYSTSMVQAQPQKPPEQEEPDLGVPEVKQPEQGEPDFKAQLVPITWDYSWRKQWYPIAFPSVTDRSRPHRVELFGEAIALWWDPVGKAWRAVLDACPHRLAPLSEGRVDEVGRIECPYHGWAFEGRRPRWEVQSC